jgi:uncharacterized cupin superfamily protein
MPIIHDPMRVPPQEPLPTLPGIPDITAGRFRRMLTKRLSLKQFGVNLTTLEPGARSSLRHWHESEDEFIYILEGELTLVTKDGETQVHVSQAISFPAGDRNGHCLVNKGTRAATFLEVGTRAKTDKVVYPDDDLVAEKSDGRWRCFHKNGDPY